VSTISGAQKHVEEIERDHEQEMSLVAPAGSGGSIIGWYGFPI
jgi:hypothetical protein